MQGQRNDDLLQILVRPGEDDIVLTLQGELDVSTAPHFRDQVHVAIESGTRKLVCDLADLQYIDSTGLSVLLMAHKRLAALGGSFVVQSPSRGARRLFEIAGVGDFLAIQP